ncbi:MAG: hypothetical protein CYG60_18645 [Actinobacteria bacterium]|nr:MAG: hypothetical protein CYG60_18645 [Actinomycetota bacterium]
MLDKLPERDRSITSDDTVRAHREAQEAHERMALRMGELSRFMKEEGLKCGLDKEERNKVTLGEILGESE